MARAKRSISTVLATQSGSCYFCGRATFPKGSADALADSGCIGTKDHLMPDSFGGRRLVMCCNGCNGVKADTPAGVFLAFVRAHKIQRWDYYHKNKYRRFVHDCDYAGFIAARALAIVERRGPIIEKKGQTTTFRAPGGRFTRANLSGGS